VPNGNAPQATVAIANQPRRCGCRNKVTTVMSGPHLAPAILQRGQVVARMRAFMHMRGPCVMVVRAGSGKAAKWQQEQRKRCKKWQKTLHELSLSGRPGGGTPGEMTASGTLYSLQSRRLKETDGMTNRTIHFKINIAIVDLNQSDELTLAKLFFCLHRRVLL
jgi:hypothetical protein